MPTRSAIQIFLFFLLFVLYWRVVRWTWRIIATVLLALIAIYYLPWPFSSQVSHGQLWLDALYAWVCGVVLAYIVPQPRAYFEHTCAFCNVFYLSILPVATLAYSSIYIPESHFALNIYLSAMVTAACCMLHSIVCTHSLCIYAALPGSAFIWGMIGPHWRFFPVSMAVLTTVLVLMALPGRRRRGRRLKHVTQWSMHVGNALEESVALSSVTYDDDDDLFGKSPTQPSVASSLHRRKRRIDDDHEGEDATDNSGIALRLVD